MLLESVIDKCYLRVPKEFNGIEIEVAENNQKIMGIKECHANEVTGAEKKSFLIHI